MALKNRYNAIHLQFAVVLNEKKAKLRHLKAQCMQAFMT